MSETIRVFLSSPGDVADERALARQVLQSLPKEELLRSKIQIEEISWDDPGNPVAMEAWLTPQKAINRKRPRPSECDVVVVVLWSRMGTPLPDDDLKPDGTPYRSGTEWEFLDAIRAAKETGVPEVWVFQRTEKKVVALDDPFRDDIQRQYDAVQEFFQGFTAAGGAFLGSVHRYSSPSQFKDLFAHFLRQWISCRLSSAMSEPVPVSHKASEESPGAWEGNPYRGLRTFGAEHTAIFFGRGLETDALVKRVREGVPVLAVIGASGSGKSSLVAAGLLPRLAAGAVPGSAQWVQVRFTPAEQGDNPFRALALALFARLPPGGLSADEIAEDLARKPEYLDKLAGKVMAGHPPTAQLLLFADQFEELFTGRVAEARRAPFVRLLEAIAETERVRLVLTLRADYYEHCTRFETLARRLRDGSFPLAAPTGRALIEMIEQPARAAGVGLEPGLVDDILQDLGDEGGSLALLGFTLERLYELRQGGPLSRVAYRALNGIAGAIALQGEKAVLDPAGKVDSAALWGVFDALAEVDDTGGAVRRRAWVRDFSEAEQSLVQSLVGARLLTADRDDGDRPWVEVAHEAVLRSWPRFCDWLEQHREFKLWRKQLKVWREGGEPLRGLPLTRAREMLGAWRDKLTAPERTYIEASLHRDRRRRRLLRGGAGLVFVLLAGAVAEFYPAYLAEQARRRPLYRAEDWVRIEPGEFCMGSRGERDSPGNCPKALPIDLEAQSWEKPAHRVRIGKPFLLAKYEVTFEEYDHFAYATHRRLPSDSGFGADRDPRLPVINVSWEDATAYAAWLSARTGRHFRLPSEAEWEYVARAGTQTPYFWTGLPGTPCDYANGFDRGHERELKSRFGGITWEPLSCDDPYATLAPVGSLRPTLWGLYDLAGNVWEWVADCYHENYEGAPEDGAAWEANETMDCGRRVIRGGSWNGDPDDLRTANRLGYFPGLRIIDLGFRLAQDL